MADLDPAAVSNPYYRSLREMAEESISYLFRRLAAGDYDWKSRPGVWTDICRNVEARTYSAQREAL